MKNNEKYNQIIDEVYEKYGQKIISEGYYMLVAIGWPSTKEEFIHKCKTDQEFSERWGLKIEERELSSVERWEWYGKNGGPNGEILYIDMIVYQNEEDNLHIKSWLEKWAPNVPTKQITVEYNEEKVEGYE